MRFGLFVPQGWRLDLDGVADSDHWPLIHELASDLDVATRSGGTWESLWVYDHFHSAPFVEDAAVHEAWTLMSALAASTQRLRLGQMCTCTGYRNPMYLAKVAATCDAIAGGRMEMGIGAGWYEPEWKAYGYGFPGAGERIGMLGEAVEILRQAWTGGTATLDGEYYQVADARCRPLPQQEGGLPLWIAGGGERKTLRIAARWADYTNFNGAPEAFEAKSQVLKKHCEEVGRDFEAITRTANYNVLIGETEAEVEAKDRDLESKITGLVGPMQAEKYMSAYRGLPCYGTPQQIVEKMTTMSELGMDYAICYFADLATTRDSLELFEREVMPALEQPS